MCGGNSGVEYSYEATAVAVFVSLVILRGIFLPAFQGDDEALLLLCD